MTKERLYQLGGLMDEKSQGNRVFLEASKGNQSGDPRAYGGLSKNFIEEEGPLASLQSPRLRYAIPK